MKTKGRHPINALTNTTVKTLKEPGRYADGQGLYLVVDRTGNKRWLLRITVPRRRRDIGLGGWPLVTLAKARSESFRLREQAKEGIDPVAERRAARKTAPTLKEAAISVHAEHLPSWRNDKHAAQWLATMEHCVFPVCGGVRVDEIDSSHVMAVLARVLPQGIGRIEHDICD